MEKKNLLIIGLVAACCLLGGVLVGVLMRPSSHETKMQTAIEEEVAIEEPAVEAEPEPEVAKQAEEKTYGFYPSFYVKRQYYTVSGAEADHTLRVYTNGEARLVKAWTDSRWLEEEKLEKGGTYFHVKENKDHETRKGKLFLKDDRGRQITIYVTQRS